MAWHCRDGHADEPAKPAKQPRIEDQVIAEEAVPLSLDADISPEEMQMMQAMGIPFGFDTTQVIT